MYQDLKETFWWNNMKRDVARFVDKCLTCQKVKAEHQRPVGELRPLEIPMWKWDSISMDFVMGLPLTASRRNAIWVIVDRLTKTAHFIAIHDTWEIDKLANIYVKEVVKLHGVPKDIISDRDPRFQARFWKALQKAFGTKLQFSSSYHPETDGQTERVNQIVEDMLRACVLDFQGKWEEYLPLAEFSYNNSYQATIKMAPFEALYGRRCRTPLCWNDLDETLILGPDMIQELVEKIKIVQRNIKAAQDRQKSYADRRRKPLEFEQGDKVFLKVSPVKGVRRFNVKGKLSPRFVGPYDIIEKINPVAYRLALPPELQHVHDVFHISQLRKYVYDPAHVIVHEPLNVDADGLTYEELPVRIVDRRVKQLRNKTIPLVKVLWTHHGVSEATWETEDEMRKYYPHLFQRYE